jgi:peroxiredoxin
MLAFSTYGAPAGVAPVGERAPAISALRVRDGATFELAAERGQTVLLVFFRGHW